ncbi:MAG: transcription antitermination factor NusB [Clostridia bacterium]|nr:transcription antitermination factor NusB [Clostridia bacterium]
MTRTQTRELAFELLYSLEIQKIEVEEQQEQINLFLKEQEIEQEKVRNYITDMVAGITKNEQEILKRITQNLKEKWDISRISKVNLTILKLAIYEIIYNKLPYKVVVNEAVELAKKYGDDTSPSFINGILANIIKQAGIANEE